MSKVHKGNHEITGVGEISFWIGERRRRPDFWECIFVDGLSDHSHASCGHHPKDHVQICIEVDTVDGHHICRISWNVHKTRKIYWHVVHYD